MITHFIEATQADEDFNHGKFMLARLDATEAKTMSALPGYEDWTLWRIGGLRQFRPGRTLVMDLQTGEGASFSLKRSWHGSAQEELNKHQIWVCPMFGPFLVWLYEQDLADGQGDITALPRFVAIDTPEGALYGYRRPGPGVSSDDG